MVLYMKLPEPFLIPAAFTEGLLCAGTVPMAFCTHYFIWLRSCEYLCSTDEKARVQQG